jgi:hypothetical protein
MNPIPFWRTNAQLFRNTSGPSSDFDMDPTDLADTGLETVEWSIDVSQAHFVLYTCDGDRLPTAVLMGPQDVSGSVTLFNFAGVFDPIIGPSGTGTLTMPYLYAEATWFVVEIVKSPDGSKVFFWLPAVVVESDDYSIPGPDSVVNRTFSMKGLGGRCSTGGYTLPPFVMSTYVAGSDGVLDTAGL